MPRKHGTVEYVAVTEPSLETTMHGDKTIENKTETANRDPLSGAPGAHPVGVGAAAGGVAAGAAIGTVERRRWGPEFGGT